MHFLTQKTKKGFSLRLCLIVILVTSGLWILISERFASSFAVGVVISTANLWFIQKTVIGMTEAQKPGKAPLIIGLILKYPLLLIGTGFLLLKIELSIPAFAVGILFPISWLLVEVLVGSFLSGED